MDTITLNQVSYSGPVNRHAPDKTYDDLIPIDYEFQFGKSYLISAPRGQGAWALSWIIGGGIQETGGVIERNGTAFSLNDRLNDAWLVRWSEIKRFGLWRMSVRAQILHGLGKHNPCLKSEHEYLDGFKIRPRYHDRKVRQLGHEAWRASCAVGLANGKSIFCFPPSATINENLMEAYRLFWLDDTLRILTSCGAMVLLPYLMAPTVDGMCDEVIRLR